MENAYEAAEVMARVMLVARRDRVSLSNAGFVRDDKRRDDLLVDYPLVPVIRPDGATQNMLLCPTCGTLLGQERDAQRCHRVPVEAIRAAAQRIGPLEGFDAATIEGVAGRVGDARRFHPLPEYWGQWGYVPGCYACNDMVQLG